MDELTSFAYFLLRKKKVRPSRQGSQQSIPYYLYPMANSKIKSSTHWADKMKKPAAPFVEVVEEQKGPVYPPGRMLIATPIAIDDIVRTIPKGELLTSGKLRNMLAAKYDADYACPMTTGIFLRIAAEYAEEQRSGGVKNITPYWRVIRDDGSLIDKLPGGVTHQAELLAKEGFTFQPKGKNNLRVKDFALHLYHA